MSARVQGRELAPRATHRRVAAALGAAALLACGGDSPVAVTGIGDPVRDAPHLVHDVVVSGTIVPGGTNSFVLDAAPDATRRLFLRATSGRTADTLIAEVTRFDSPGGRFAAVTSVGTDASLDDQVSEQLPTYSSGQLLVTVRGRGADDAGSYELVVREPDPRPETASATVAIGDTIVEAIDRYGDVDEFTFAATAGDELLVFLHDVARAPGGALDAQVIDAAGTPIAELVGGGSGSLDEQSLPVRIPATGSYTLRITGLGFYWQEPVSWRGAYRARLYRVRRAPEHAPATVAIGDTVAESIDEVGDVDEFSFAANGGDEIYVNLALERGLSSELRLDVLKGASTIAEVRTRGAQLTLDETGSGRFLIPSSGTYTVRLAGATAGKRDSTTTPYRFELYRVRRAPERAAPAAVLGDTIRGEAIDRPGDVDEFTFTVAAGERIRPSLTVLDAGAEERFFIELLDPAGTLVGNATSATGSDHYSSGNGADIRPYATAERAGLYKVRVSGFGPSTAAYSLELRRIDPAPETLPPQIAIGTPVVGEKFDRAGDLDVFTFNATAGQRLNILVKMAPGVTGYAFLMVGGTFAQGVSWEGATGVFTVPETKSYTVTVTGDLGDGILGGGTVGGYEFTVVEIDSRPETVAPTIAIDQTVVGESLDPAGDEDEFTFSGVAGDRLRTLFDAGTAELPLRFVIAVFEESTKRQLVGIYADSPVEWGDFELPSTGRYIVRVVPAVPTNIPANAVGPYRFTIARRP